MSKNLSPHSRKWSPEEDANLRDIHALGLAYKAHMHLWPRRNLRGVTCRAHKLQLGPKAQTYVKPSLVWISVLSELEKGIPMDVYQLADRLRCCPETCRKLLKKNIQEEERQVHIARWKRCPNHNWSPMWGFGEGPSPAKPKAQTEEERHARRRKIRAFKRMEFNPFATAMMQMQV